ncbi:MAG: hypothetical protein WAP35_00030 [Solirubrobacterales bacterium]
MNLRDATGARGPKPYRAHPLRRVRAFFFTDRVGHTIASTAGFTRIVLWWARGRVKRMLRGGAV